MKKKIAILGATGSIGQTTLRIIKNNKKLSVELLTTNKNYKKLITYAKDFNVKNVIIFDNTTFLKQKLLFKNKKLIYLMIFMNIKKIKNLIMLFQLFQEFQD